MSLAHSIRGPILNPAIDRTVDFIPDGVLACDERGALQFMGPASDLPPQFPPPRQSRGIIMPPFHDAHIHIPQHPIRGRFMEGIGANPPQGRLMAGLNRNVFPAEARCAEESIAEQVVREFEADTLAKGVVGGTAYMTAHTRATDIALARLDKLWNVGLVLMEMNCPEDLRVNPDTVVDEMFNLLDTHGRLAVTDRFAVAVGSDLRRRACAFAGKWGLRTQTHLNEQLREKEFVEKTLYPSYASYTDVYLQDGLLEHAPILAHCVHMTDAELDILAHKTRVPPLVAHCPTSNTLLGSGIMRLDRIVDRKIPYAICTDVGASPTTSMLAEMAQFLKVHAGRSRYGTPREALYRATLAPVWELGAHEKAGNLTLEQYMSFIEVDCGDAADFTDAEDAIFRGLLGMTEADLDRYARPGPHREAMNQLATGTMEAGPALELLERDIRQTAARMENRVIAVTLRGKEVFRRSADKAV